MEQFHELLDASCILTNWRPTDKWQAIRDLIEFVQASGKITSQQADAVTDAVYEREHKMSTGIEAGIAIPHASTNAVSTMTVAMGLSPAGFDFESLDGEPTHIVVLLVYPANQVQGHVRILALIARLLGQATVREKLLAAEDADAVLQVLQATSEA